MTQNRYTIYGRLEVAGDVSFGLNRKGYQGLLLAVNYEVASSFRDNPKTFC